MSTQNWTKETFLTKNSSCQAIDEKNLDEDTKAHLNHSYCSMLSP